MTTNRRNFLRNTLWGTGILATGFSGQAALLGNSPAGEKKKEMQNSVTICVGIPPQNWMWCV
jgi:hypothetical protein